MAKKLTKPQGDGKAVKLISEEGRSDEFLAARVHLDVPARHAVLTKAATVEFFGGEATCGVTDHMDVIDDAANSVAGGDLAVASRTLTAQALSLDVLFTQLVRRAEVNIGEYPDAVERYLRFALKAQAQSRATLETLVKMHQPREQTVRHVHVGPDGQAVFIENYAGGLGNVRSAERPLAPCADGPALLGAHPSGTPLPGTGGEREEAVPHARRRGRVRRTARQS